MPLVRIAVPSHRDAAYRRALADAVHGALVEALDIPKADRFQIITSHAPDELVYDPTYLDVARTAEFVAVHITLRRGRTPAKKRALYKAIAERAHRATATRPEDLLIVLAENDAIDWSFGGGVAQYAPQD